MKTFLKKWWSPLLTHPMAFGFVVIGLPYLLHKIHNMHSVTFFLMAGLAFLSAEGLALYHVRSLKVASIVSVFVFYFSYFTWPQEQMGNWHMQYANHILSWTLIGFSIIGATESYLLYRKKA